MDESRSQTAPARASAQPQATSNITTRMMRDPFAWIAMGMFLIATVAICSIFAVVYSQLPGKEDLTENTTRWGLMVVLFGARLMQTTLAMLIGMLFALLGAIMAWHGVTGHLEGEVNAPTFSARLATASPGVFLILCGTVIIVACLVKEFTLEAQEPVRPAVGGSSHVQPPTDGT